MKPIQYEVQDKPICRICRTDLIKLGNSLRHSDGTTTTYGWCMDCNYYQWSLPWETHLSNSEIIKNQYR